MIMGDKNKLILFERLKEAVKLDVNSVKVLVLPHAALNNINPMKILMISAI